MQCSCTNCGKEFYRKDSQVKQVLNVFCSQSCAAQYNNRMYPKRTPMEVKENVNIKRTTIELTCPVCGNTFFRKEKNVKESFKNGWVPTCSKECNAVNQRKRTNRNKKCKSCDTLILTKYTYCDDCRKINDQKVLDYTIGQIRELYKDKSGMAFAAKIRGYGATIYNRSDNPKYCVRCGYSLHFEICHIKAVKDFPDDATMAEVHALDNLIALCCNCHWEYDHGMLTLDEIRKAA